MITRGEERIHLIKEEKMSTKENIVETIVTILFVVFCIGLFMLIF